ncbi:MAG: PEP-CTERM/exosortase system-associated acyltransferase [Candidatus Competibacter sp.]|nr:PEP-CTERM/exosortase system-associated acyltransferase [Candidatus Competibacter sp.]
MHVPSLDSDFQDYFRVTLARTPELLEQVYRIRFDVYCQEFQYEREERCPGGLERDEYDPCSLHCLIVHRPSNASAGCIRLILPDAVTPEYPLPMERFCGHSLTHPLRHPSRLPRAGVTEVSRLAVHTRFRRCLGDFTSQANRVAHGDGFSPAERRIFPLLCPALFCAGAALMVLAQRQHAFVMAEPCLARRMQGVGFPFVQVGHPIEYHGPRAAYYVHVQQVLENLKGLVKNLYDFVFDSLQQDAARVDLGLSSS